jgi:hypothetical protein
VIPEFAGPIKHVSPGAQSMLLQHVGVPWFPENIVTPTWELVTALLMFAAAYMSIYSEPSAVNEVP